MAVVRKSDLKNYFNKGDKPTEAQFADLIDSFVHVENNEFINISASGDINSSLVSTVNLASSTSSLGFIQPSGSILDIIVSGNLVPAADESFTSSFSLGSPEAAWKDLFVSEDSIKFIKKSGSGESEELARITIDPDKKTIKFVGLDQSSSFDNKDLELRQVQFGKNVTKGATINDGGGDRTGGFVAMHMQHRETEILGGAIVMRPELESLGVLGENFVSHQFQAKGSGSIAMLINADQTNDNRSFFSVENAGLGGIGITLFKVFPNKSKFYGADKQVEFEADIVGTKGSFTGGDVVIEEGVVVQPGVISQSISIGNLSGTSPSTLGMIGVGDNCHIRIAEGVTVRVNEGSLFKIQCPQPDVNVNTDNDAITIGNGGGDEIIFTTGQFGTNPQYIPNHLVVPSNQVAIWYGPIYVGRFTLNPFGTDFDPDGAGVLNMDLAGQGDNASLRIHNGAQIKVQAF